MRVVTIFGSNSGDKHQLMEKAMNLLSEKAGEIILFSSDYETEPWGFESEENFLNRVVVFETALSPETFLQASLDVESQLGRVRNSHAPRYISRTIDIDILFYGAQIIHTPNLIVPHPRLTERNFVLIPLNEIMPEFVHPESGKTIHTLLEECPDRLEAKKCGERAGVTTTL